MSNTLLSIGVGLYGSMLIMRESLKRISKSIIHNKNPHVLDILTFMLSGPLVCAYNYALYEQLKN